jgi:predicted CXXCH cytochrome family protein
VEGGFECTKCHTVAERPDEATLRTTASGSCLSCHTSLRPAHAGHVAVGGGDITCLQCHDMGAPPMATSTDEMAAMCGGCHEDALRGVMAGGHAKAEGGPDCVTCHVVHVDPQEEASLTRLTATVRCLECHSQGLRGERFGMPGSVAASYTDDFHGTTLQFLASHQSAGTDYPPVMVCSDCHGAHQVGWTDADLVSDVCKRCHEDSDERFAGAWLGHRPVGPTSQPLIWMVRVFYLFLIPFMLVGLFLNILFHIVDQRRSGARVLKTEGVQRMLSWLRREPKPKPDTVTRFSVTDRLDHLGSMLTFIGLVVTGLPQTRPDLGIARAIIGFFGGIGTTRVIHRVIGVLFVALMLMHVGRAVIRAIRRRRLPAMVPARKDFDDVLQTFRHYLFGERLPRVGKFDFSEKFEYWGLFLGGIVMSSTGIILMFPELVTQFLPGVVVAATRVMHGLEATFAVMVVILWHSYGVMLRPEVFPLDTSIFTGKMDLHRLKHEHALEYERLFPDAATDEEEAGGEEDAPSLFDGTSKGLAET